MLSYFLFPVGYYDPGYWPSGSDVAPTPIPQVSGTKTVFPPTRQNPFPKCNTVRCGIFVGTFSYTAKCPSGQTGDSVTVTRQCKSVHSVAHARELARKAAKAAAEAALVCE